ncbi:MAG: hypothetical protein ACI4WG_03405 [Erysipelotrichaceae bacterium]
MKKYYKLFVALLAGLLLITACSLKDEANQDSKTVVKNLLNNMIENNDAAFLDVTGYCGMDENKKFLLRSDIALYSYQYLKYSIDKKEDLGDNSYLYIVEITAVDFSEVKKNYPENTARDNELIKQAIDSTKNKTLTSKVSIKVSIDDMSGCYKIQLDDDFFKAVLPNYQQFIEDFN